MKDIKHQFVTSSFWVILGRGSTNLVGFLLFSLLARFLGPTNYGLVAFAALFIELTRPLALAGFPQALIQRSSWDDEVSSNAFWANIGLAIIVALVLSLAFAPVMTVAYDPMMQWVLPSLAATLVIDAGRAPYEALLQRRFAFKLLATRNVIAMVISGIIGVALAYAGFGVWALVINRVANSIISTVIIVSTVSWRPRFTFSISTVKPLFAFGIHLTGTSLIQQVNQRIPDLMIGAFLGPAAVGIFRVGSRAVNILTDAVIQPMSATALPAFSRVKEKGSVADAYLRVTKVCGLLSYPIYYGAAVVATDFVTVCFGEKWHSSGEVMAMLALFGGAGTLNYFSGSALAAVGRSSLMFWASVLSLVFLTITTLITLPYGVSAVALGFTARAYVVLPFLLLLLKKGLELDPWTAVKGIMPPFTAAVIMALLLLALRAELLEGLHPLPRMCIMVAVGAAIYPLALFAVSRRYVRDMHGEISPIIVRLTKRFRA